MRLHDIFSAKKRSRAGRNLMADTTVSTTDNGPYWVSGNFIVSDADGNQFPVEGEAYLCRCGQSDEKPFCDGSHNSAGFDDSCRA